MLTHHVQTGNPSLIYCSLNGPSTSEELNDEENSSEDEKEVNDSATEFHCESN